MKRHTSPPSGLRPVSAVILGVVLCAATAAAQGPTLGEIAREEAERRKAQPSAGKVYTNKDLPASAQERAPAPPSDSEASTAPRPAAAAEAGKGKDAAAAKPEQAPRNEAWWKARLVKAGDELRQNERLAESLQLRINALGRAFVSRDDPVQRARIGEERAEALVELARVRQEIEQGRTAIAGIEEEARRAGVPPGWLR